ncbi:unnamed protein product [Pleuronectes platessa]|uniref:Uncharacterized protein n=1 Tax=Pleuronectes platessa TaxID=8262 RepID=A0A9N7V990_PLEPL|nr:unnamed protein product [Pleuronectes platessa]
MPPLPSVPLLLHPDTSCQIPFLSSFLCTPQTHPPQHLAVCREAGANQRTPVSEPREPDIEPSTDNGWVWIFCLCPATIVVECERTTLFMRQTVRLQSPAQSGPTQPSPARPSQH